MKTSRTLSLMAVMRSPRPSASHSRFRTSSLLDAGAVEFADLAEIQVDRLAAVERTEQLLLNAGSSVDVQIPAQSERGRA